MANRTGSVWKRVASRARRSAPRKGGSTSNTKAGRLGSAAVGFVEVAGAAAATGAYHGAVGETVGPVRATAVTRTGAGVLTVLGMIQAWRGKGSAKHLLALGEGMVAAEVSHAARERVAKMKADRAAAAQVPAPAPANPAPNAPGAHGLGEQFQFLISDREGLASPPALAGDHNRAELHPLLG